MKEKEQLVVRNDVDVNEHERLSNVTNSPNLTSRKSDLLLLYICIDITRTL